VTGRQRGVRDQRVRLALAPAVASGTVLCPRCGDPIRPDEPWDVGHVLALAEGGHPAGPRRPEHAACNRRAGAQMVNARRPQRRTRLDEWLEQHDTEAE
jgi:hypothetical protein